MARLSLVSHASPNVVHANRGVRRYYRHRRPTGQDDADKTRRQVYRRGENWLCTFNIEYDADMSGETPIGVDIGEHHILAVTAYGEGELMLVSGGEAKYVRGKYRSLRDSLSDRMEEVERIRVEKIDAYHTSRQSLECNRGRHVDLNASENIVQREGEPRANTSGEANRAPSLVE
ncbi:MAG: hypothetical protein J07HQX50_01879 [Haloquadratum sp. J07HQX50]|jgi:hypothetical protein|nr:MAG: hypothetical protein J07HQX50_01879 [Haloquadratum sp. J07HQX50]